jgi:glutaredoxin
MHLAELIHALVKQKSSSSTLQPRTLGNRQKVYYGVDCGGFKDRKPPAMHGTMALDEILMYTRQGCCLCDQAVAQLQEHGLVVNKIDIDADPALRARYTDCVPVVFINGRERFRGRIDPRLLRRILNHESHDAAP